MLRRDLLIEIILGAAFIAAFTLAGWSFYNGHRNSCQSRDATLNVVRDILVATDPDPSRNRAAIPPAKRTRADDFYVSAYNRINEARCQ